MKKTIWINSTLWLLLSLSACQTKPPDFPICVEMSMVRGECIKVISGQKMKVDDTNLLNGKTWWDSRPTNLILPMESWIDLKKFIIKLCKANKNMCEKEVSTWERSLETIDSKMSEKGSK